MPKFDRFLIAPSNTGLQTDLKPWLVPDDSLVSLKNAYVFRGRIIKRFGSRFMGTGWSSAQTEPLFSRLRINLGNTSGGVKTGTVPGIVFKLGQAFSVGTTIFTVVSGAAGVQNMLSTGGGVIVGTTDGAGNFSGTFLATPPAIVGQSFNIAGTIFTIAILGNAANALTVSGLGVGTGTYNSVTGALVFAGAAATSPIAFNGAAGTYNVSNGAYVVAGLSTSATPVWFYPGESVMGLTNYSPGESINNQQAYAFDTQFSYTFAGGFWQRTPSVINAIWNNPSGNYLNFFWSYNWQGINSYPQIMFTTNYQVTNYNGAATTTDDPIWFYDGSGVIFGSGSPTWTPAIGVNAFYFRPGGGAQYTGPFVQTARLVVPFKNRLVLLNTVESSGTTSAALGNTDGAGNASGNSTGGIIGEYFQIGTTYFTIISLTGALQVSAGGTGTGTYNISTGAYTFTGASAVTAIKFFKTLGTLTNFNNRARFCHVGTPFSVNAWYEQNQKDSSSPAKVGDGGGYIDASTDEEIISCEFIKDRLIVYFERSTWELAFTNNQVDPFSWQKINTELGSESQFSTVPFDKEILTIGNTGIHSCNGANVQRIDVKIPDEIFEISNKNTGVQRVVGIRDYFAEMVYWCFPAENTNQSDTYPNLVLTYNYRNNCWGLNDDCITMFGYFEQEAGVTWASTTTNWSQSNFSWESGIQQANSRQVIAGNMQGYVFLIEAGDPDGSDSRNERAMQITNLTYPSAGIVQLTLVDHTLEATDFISIENAGGVTVTTPVNYEVTNIVNSNTIRVADPLNTLSGTYTGGGNSARISRIDILSKQWNPYISQDRNVFIQRIDFGVTATSKGAITVDYFPSGSEVSLINDGGSLGTNSMIGNNILETSPYPISLAPLEQEQELLWHPVYFQSDGTLIQIRIYLSDAQMINQSTAWSFFEVQGMCLYTQPTTSRMN